MDRSLRNRTGTVSEAKSASYIIEMLTMLCIMCRLGFPGNLAVIFGGEKAIQAVDYGSSFLQLLLIMLCSGSTFLEIKLIDLKRKYLPVYLMLVLMFTVSMMVTENRGKQTTMIIHFSLTALFGLWLADRYEPEQLLEVICVALAGIVLANLLTLFVFRSAGYYNDDGYGYTFRGLYTQKNGLGSVFAYGTALQITLLRIRRRKGQRISGFFLSVLCAQVFLLVISQATTAIFCCILPILYQIMYDRTNGEKHRIQWGIVYTVVTIGFLFIAMTILPLFAPVLEAIGKDATLSNRTPMWEKIIEFLTEHNTFTGYGLLQFWETPSALKKLHTYFERNSWFRSMAYGAHSTLLEMWLDLGLIGVTSYFLTLIVSFSHVKRLTRDEYILCSVFVLPLMIGGLTDRHFTNSNYATLFFFVMVGLASRGSERNMEKKPARMKKGQGAALRNTSEDGF